MEPGPNFGCQATAGRFGTGTVTLTNGATLTETAVAGDPPSVFGRGNGVGSTGTGFLNVLSDSTATFSDSLSFGLDGDTGVGLVSDGTLNVGGQLTVGDSGNGTLNLTTGGAAITEPPSGTGAALTVGAQAGGTGSISVSGYGSALIAVGEAVLGGTDTGTGAVAGGTGNISLSQGGFLGAWSMVIESGSSLGIDGRSAALIAGNLSDGGAITTSGLLAVTGTVSGAGSLTLDGGLTDAGGLAGANVNFGSPGAVLRVHALSGASNVSGMQTGDVIDLAGMKGVALAGDTVTANGGMLFLSPAPAGDAYRLVTNQHGTEVLLVPTSAYGMNDAAMVHMGASFGGMDDLPHASADLMPNLGFTPAAAMMPVTAAGEMAGYMGAAPGTGVTFTGIDMAMLFAH
jgi:hypothetical protein